MSSIADALLEREVLDFDQIARLVKGVELDPFVLPIPGGAPAGAQPAPGEKVKSPKPSLVPPPTEQPA